MKRIYLLLSFLLIYISSFSQILTITGSEDFQSYTINGTTAGNQLIASEVDPETIRLFNVGLNSSNDYKTTSSFSDFFINGKNPTDVSNAVELINNITKKLTVDSFTQDGTSPLMIVKASQLITETTLTAQTSIGDYIINISDATGFIVGQYLTIYNEPNNRVYFSNILSINVLEITLDRQLDFEYPIGSFVSVGNTNMNVNGSVTPQIFGIRNPTAVDVPLAFDITRIMFKCLTTNANDLSKFGDIDGGLTRGIVIRRINGDTRNILNAKTNSDLKELMYDFEIEAFVGQGQNGFTGRLTFAGQNKMGAVVRIGENEDLQIIIQDDLTSLLEFTITAQGSEVTNGIFILLLFYRKKLKLTA